MRMVVAALLAAVVWRPVPAAAQFQISQVDDPPRLAGYFEVGGASRVSLNMDALVRPELSVRVGGILPMASNENDPSWNAIVTVSRLFGSDGSYLETGLGIVWDHNFGSESDPATRAGATASIAYRRQTRHGIGRVGISTPPPRHSPFESWYPVMFFSYGMTF